MRDKHRILVDGIGFDGFGYLVCTCGIVWQAIGRIPTIEWRRHMRAIERR